MSQKQPEQIENRPAQSLALQGELKTLAAYTGPTPAMGYVGFVNISRVANGIQITVRPESVDGLGSASLIIPESSARDLMTTAAAQLGGGWIVGNADATMWRTWGPSGPEWTEDRNAATRYARRADAEAVHADDEDAWRIEPFATSREHPCDQ